MPTLTTQHSPFSIQNSRPPRSVPVDLDQAIALARDNLRYARIALRQRRTALNRLLARRAELLNRADARFNANMEDPEYRGALEAALSGEGTLEQKLAHGMQLADPDDDEEPSDDGDEDDTVLRTPIDYDQEGAEAKAMLQAIHGDDLDQQMQNSFADEVERLAQDDIREALRDAAMDDIHGQGEAYLDSNGDA